MKLTIDNQEIELEEATTIFHAAKKLGIEIPIMCYRDGYDYFTSCMMCTVKDQSSGKTHPACSALCADGMEIDTQCDEIMEHHKSTLELLLSEHVGDCEAPCQRLCSIHSEIPKMIREIKDDQFDDAIATVREDMAIPSILERFCTAPCEKGCRRAQYDDGVSIRHMTRFISDWDLKRETPYIPPMRENSGKKIVIVGSGATGLATAYYLMREGHACTIIEKDEQLGGRLRSEEDYDQSLMENWVIEGEVKVLKMMGAEFKTSYGLGDQVSLDALKADYQAVVLTCGHIGNEALEAIGIPADEKKGIKVDRKTALTEVEGVFAAGSITKAKMPILKAVQAAKDVAACASQYANEVKIDGIVEMYNHMMGRLQEGEIDIFVTGANPIARVTPDNLEVDGYNKADVQLEGERCMHCDCRASHDCSLRIYSDKYGAKQSMFKGEQRAKYDHVNENAGAVYESGKCIKCSLCVQITKEEDETYGFTFVGRGFNVTAGVSLDKTLWEGLEHVADKVVEACPTGALSTNEKYQPEQGKIVGAELVNAEKASGEETPSPNAESVEIAQ